MPHRIRQYVSYLIIALIALQSVVTMADVHQFHQSGTEHLTFEHEHDHQHTTTGEALEAGDDLSTTAFDCHHCCHCHGMAQLFLGNGQSSSLAFLKGYQMPNYQSRYYSHHAAPDNPPPIV